MSKASQRAMSRRKKKPAIDFFDLVISASEAEDAGTRERFSAALTAEFVKNEFVKFKREQGSRFNEEAHKALDEVMMRDIKPLLEEIKAAMTSSGKEYLGPEAFSKQTNMPSLTGTPMARSNSPTLGHPKFPQAGRLDYGDSGVMAMRAAASLRR